MKKILSSFILFSVLSMGAVAALSVVPHAHGDDLHHGQNETCPVHQFGLKSAHADVCITAVFAAVFLFCGVILFQKKIPSRFFRFFGSLRAPPALLSF